MRNSPQVVIACVGFFVWPTSPGLMAQTQVVFEWRLEDRFGLDLDGDGLIDIPNTAEYAQPATLRVLLDATGTRLVVGGTPVPPTRYDWWVSDTGGRRFKRTDVPQVEFALPMGTYEVHLQARNGDTVAETRDT